MASGTALQRAGVAPSPVGTPGRLPNLPFIEHPMSRLGDRKDLAITGLSATGPSRQNTAIGIERSKTEMVPRGQLKDSENPDNRKGTPERILNWPPGSLIFLVVVYF